MLKLPLERVTERSVSRPSDVRARLDAVRRAGFCWTIEELEPGIASVAAPVFNADGECIAAVHIHGPSYGFPEAHREPAVTDIACRLSARLSADAG